MLCCFFDADGSWGAFHSAGCIISYRLLDAFLSIIIIIYFSVSDIRFRLFDPA